MANWQQRHKAVPAVYIVLRQNGKILVAQRANTGYMDGYYSLPSGHLDGGEPATTAACREALEEVGVRIKPEDLQFVHVSHRLAVEGDHERTDFYFSVINWEGEPKNNEPDKCSEIRWVTPDDLPKPMAPEVAHAITCIEKGMPFSEYGF